MNPIEDALERARQDHLAGRLKDAEHGYRFALSKEPQNSKALHLLAILAGQVGRRDVAVELIKRVLQLEPTNAYAHCEYGSLMYAAGDFHGAVESYQRALHYHPQFAEAQNNMGNAFLAMHRLGEAKKGYLAAIQLKPHFAEAHINLGTIFQLTENNAEAIRLFKTAIEMQPESAPAHYNLGNALQISGLLDEACNAFTRAIHLKTDYTAAYNNLGNLHKERGEIEPALNCYRKAHAIDPANAVVHSNLIYGLHFDPLASAGDIFAETARWDLLHARPLLHLTQPHPNDPAPERRLRIGYLSPDFREHVVAYNLLPLMEAHDREEFDIYCYSHVLHADAVTNEVRALCDSWRDISGLNDEQAAEVIRADKIDILVDLALHAEGNRLLVFARKPAPIQATYLAYCGTSGMEAMDYRFSDWQLDPSEADLGCYRERTIRLPRTYWCYRSPVHSSKVSALPATENGYITFGCLNNFAKQTKLVLELWASVLVATPGSRLKLHAPEGSIRESVLRCFADNGVKPERIQFFSRQLPKDYLQTWQSIDIGLDPFPYNGGITTCDALWMGIPVVTYSGDTAVGRAGRSILTSIGLQELVAKTQRDYFKVAVSLSGDLQKLAEMRSTLRSRFEISPLKDSQGFAHDIEAAYRAAWKEWCATVAIK